MVMYAVHYFNDRAGSWLHLSAVRACPNRETVLRDLKRYFRIAGKTKRAETRQYRLAKFHYGGCRHVGNARAK